MKQLRYLTICVILSGDAAQCGKNNLFKAIILPESPRHLAAALACTHEGMRRIESKEPSATKKVFQRRKKSLKPAQPLAIDLAGKVPAQCYPDDVTALLNATVKPDACLASLDLSFNNLFWLGVDGMLTIVRALPKNLLELDLSFNNLSSDYRGEDLMQGPADEVEAGENETMMPNYWRRVLPDLISQCPQLWCLKLQGNGLSQDDRLALADHRFYAKLESPDCFIKVPSR